MVESFWRWAGTDSKSKRSSVKIRSTSAGSPIFASSSFARASAPTTSRSGSRSNSLRMAELGAPTMHIDNDASLRTQNPEPRTPRALELENPFSAKRPPDAVVELAERRARQVALIVARIEMIRDVEHLQPDRRVVAEQAQLLRDLGVDGDERRIATGCVSQSDEIAIEVYLRIRKSGPRVNHREDREPARHRKAAPPH